MSSWLGNIPFESISFKVLYGFSMPVSEFPVHTAPLTCPVPVRILQPLCSPVEHFLPLTVGVQNQAGHSQQQLRLRALAVLGEGWGPGNALHTHLEEASLG